MRLTYIHFKIDTHTLCTYDFEAIRYFGRRIKRILSMQENPQCNKDSLCSLKAKAYAQSKISLRSASTEIQ